MRLSDYGVVLNRLTIDKIEMIRNWRNDPKITQYMEYREYITPEMQTKWFHSINNENNYYFIIEKNGEEIGLINVRDIDYDKMEGEGGIFIYKDKYLNSLVSFDATLCLYDFCAYELKLKSLIARVLKTNTRAIRFNKIIGFSIIDGQEDVENQMYRLYIEDDYIRQRYRIKRVLKNVQS